MPLQIPKKQKAYFSGMFSSILRRISKMSLDNGEPILLLKEEAQNQKV